MIVFNCINESGNRFDKTFYDIAAARRWFFRAAHSRKIMIIGCDYSSEAVGDIVARWMSYAGQR